MIRVIKVRDKTSGWRFNKEWSLTPPGQKSWGIDLNKIRRLNKIKKVNYRIQKKTGQNFEGVIKKRKKWKKGKEEKGGKKEEKGKRDKGRRKGNGSKIEENNPYFVSLFNIQALMTAKISQQKKQGRIFQNLRGIEIFFRVAIMYTPVWRLTPGYRPWRLTT